MRGLAGLAIVLGLTAGAARAADSALAQGCGANAPPASWTLKQIEKESPPFLKGERPILLAWSILEDDRPLRVENALVARHSPDGYLIEHLYRHPEDKPPAWNLAMTHVSPMQGSNQPGFMIFHQDLFDHRPSNDEIYASLKPELVDWSFEVEEGWKLLGGGVCEPNWIALTGEKPTKRYPATK